jgi:outer membrane lipoprotein-sorting protein
LTVGGIGWLAGIVLLLSSCAARAPEPVTLDPTYVPTALELDQRLRERRAELSRFRGQARLAYHSDDESGKVSQMIAVEEPDRVRIDFMSPFGPTYTVAANGSRLVAYDRGEKVLYQGEPSAKNVFRYTRVPATVDLLASLIRGLPPDLDRLGEPTVQEHSDGWHWVVALRGGGLLTVVFQKGSLVPLSASITGSRETGDFEARFADYEDVGGVPTPHRVEATLPGGGEVELKYSRIWRDVGLTDDAFTIGAPSGVRIVDMDRLGDGAGGG